ncbi:MAG: hypothetical protein AAFN70_15110, partial [Planctomycetota bacterium]
LAGQTTRTDKLGNRLAVRPTGNAAQPSLFAGDDDDPLDATLQDGDADTEVSAAATESLRPPMPTQSLLPIIDAAMQEQSSSEAAEESDLAFRAPLLEIQLVDCADSIAYDAHDVDDALQLGLLSIDSLRQLDIIARALDTVRARYANLSAGRLRQALIHQLIELQVSDLLDQCQQQLGQWEGAPSDAVLASGLMFSHSRRIAAERRQLEVFLFQNVYRHRRLMEIRGPAQERLRSMLVALANDPSRLPLRFRQRSVRFGRRLAATQYIAGMTDRFFDTQYEYLQSGNRGPLADW